MCATDECVSKTNISITCLTHNIYVILQIKYLYKSITHIDINQFKSITNIDMNILK